MDDSSGGPCCVSGWRISRAPSVYSKSLFVLQISLSIYLSDSSLPADRVSNFTHKWQFLPYIYTFVCTFSLFCLSLFHNFWHINTHTYTSNDDSSKPEFQRCCNLSFLTSYRQKKNPIPWKAQPTKHRIDWDFKDFFTSLFSLPIAKHQ